MYMSNILLNKMFVSQEAHIAALMFMFAHILVFLGFISILTNGRGFDDAFTLFSFISQLLRFRCFCLVLFFYYVFNYKLLRLNV